MKRATAVDSRKCCIVNVFDLTSCGSSSTTYFRSQTCNWGPERGVRTTRGAYDESNAAHNGTDELDTERQVSFLTDKCNALARRLQQVETQLLKERADGKKRLHETATAASSSRSAESWNNGSNNPSYSYESAPCHPGASPSPRNFGGSSLPSSQAPRASSADLDNHGGSGDGKTNNMGAGVGRKAGAYPTPRTAGSTGSNKNRAPLSPERGHAPGEQQQRPHSSGVVSGVMMPPDVVQAIRDSKKPPRRSGSRMDGEALHCEVVEKEIADRFDVVTDGIERLENVFSGAAQILEHRVHAITTISR